MAKIRDMIKGKSQMCLLDMSIMHVIKCVIDTFPIAKFWKRFFFGSKLMEEMSGAICI